MACAACCARFRPSHPKGFVTTPTVSAPSSFATDATLGAAVSTGANAALVSCILYGTWALGLWYGSYLIRQDMKRHDYCNYRRDASGDLREPNNKCISGGDVMTAFLCVLFGGLALLQALPGIAAYQLARSEATRVFRIIDEADATAIADAANLGSVASTTKTASHVCKMPPTNAAALTAGR